MINKEEYFHGERKNTSRKRIYLPDKIVITNELMRLFGLFLGDGSIDVKNRRITFTFNEEEYDIYYQSFVQKALDKDLNLNGSYSIGRRIANHRVDLSIGSVECFDLFYWLFGKANTYNKKIPEQLLHISPELDMELFYGYFLADGYFRERETKFNRPKNYTSCEIVTASVSKNLSYGMRDLLLSFGINSSITRSKERTDEKGVHHNQAWYISVSSPELEEAWIKKSYRNHINIVKGFKELQEKTAKNRVYDSRTDTSFIVTPLKEIYPINISEYVYCLNNTSHSFVCGGVVVHNCLGSLLDKKILELTQAETYGDTEGERQAHRDIVRFLKWCINTYGKNNFSLEIQPARSEEQLIVNKRMKSIAQAFGLPICITCDSHYLRKENRFIHKALLNSKDGDREVDSFYEYCYLQSEDEIRENLSGTGLNYEELCANSMKIYDRCEYYTLHRNQHIVEVPVPDYPREPENEHKYDVEKYPTLDKLMHSDNPQERYWINYCQEELDKKGLSNETYLSRLEEEADIQDVIGHKLDTCMFAYPIFLQHYINLFWDCGSTVGAGRGSACSGLNHWLLGVTQLDPIKNNLPYWRYLNKDRIELGDVDIDLCPSKRELIFEKIREERGPLGCVQVCTYGTISTKAAIKIACRGYRSPDYPDGIPLEEAEYLSSLIPQERGFLFPLSDCFYGNEKKDRKPSTTFINTVAQYPGLKEILLGIEGLISQRGIHASGVNFYGEDPYETACFMKAKNGAVITQYSLHDTESANARLLNA